MCNTVDREMNVKKILELRHTEDEYVELQITMRGMPMNPTRKSDTAKLVSITLLDVLKFE